jgi:hypothetical protein
MSKLPQEVNGILDWLSKNPKGKAAVARAAYSESNITIWNEVY